MASLSKNKEFYAEVYKTARELGYSPVQAELAASQAYHESMSRLGVAGGSGLAKNHNNLFGMKAGSSWNGPVANMKTQEEVKGRNVTIRDAFRAYPTKRDSIIDYFDRLKSRWPEAYKAKTLDEAIAGLGFGKKGGYATDTNYGSKIARTALSNTPAREVAERRVANIFGANPVPTSAPKPGIDGERIAYNPTRDQFGDKAAIPQLGAAARLASQLAQYRPSQGGLIPQGRIPVPTPAPRVNMSAAPTSDFRTGPKPLTITPNKVNTFNFTPANIDPARFAPQVSPAELAAQYAQYQRGTPITAPREITPSRPTVNIDTTRFSPGPSVAELANQYAQYRSGTVPPAPAAAAVNIDRSRFNNAPTAQPNMTANDVRNSYHDQLAGRLNAPTFAAGPTTSQSVRNAQANLATSNRRDQFVRDVLKGGVEVTVSPQAPGVNVDRGRFTPGPSKAELANQYAQYQRGTVPSAQINPTVYDMVDVPQSSTIASQYASYGAGKMNAPQVAASATQAAPVAPSIPNVPQTAAPRAPSIPGPASPTVNAPMTQQQRLDKALADMRVGIPPQDIYDQNAPGRSGFRGFGAGGFLGNLLTGNIGNMAGIEGGNRLPGILGVIQGVVQGLGGPQQAAQAVQGAVPALGQVMGLPAAQQAARAGNNMVIGRDANGILGWMADGGLSGGAFNAGWSANNPERNYGGYGGGYDPTPV